MESVNSKRRKIIVVIIFTIIAMLIWLSSEVSFMPNYRRRPDKIYLVYPMVIFCLALFIEFLWSLIVMYDHKKILWDVLIFLIVTFFSFGYLVGNFQDYGYVGLIITLVFMIGFYFLKRKNDEKDGSNDSE